MDDIRYKQILNSVAKMQGTLQVLETGLAELTRFIEDARNDNARFQAAKAGESAFLPRSFQMFEQQDKGEAFRSALSTYGYRQVSDLRRAGFVLSHHDQMWELNSVKHEKKPFFIHPHSARSMIMWDGIYPASQHVTANFVFAEGHREIMKRYGYPRPVEVCGWPYSEVREFKPSAEAKNVLFAPIHPNRGATNKLSAVDAKLNRRAYEALKGSGVHLTVRYWDTLEANGLEKASGVEYVPAELSLASTLKVLNREWDVVVGHQTFAYVAIALGIPTVMFGEDVPPHNLATPVKSWDRYKDIVMYPLDLLDGKSAMEILECAARSDHEIKEWKQRMIGEAFEPRSFVDKLEAYL